MEYSAEATLADEDHSQYSAELQFSTGAELPISETFDEIAHKLNVSDAPNGRPLTDDATTPSLLSMAETTSEDNRSSPSPAPAMSKRPPPSDQVIDLLDDDDGHASTDDAVDSMQEHLELSRKKARKAHDNEPVHSREENIGDKVKSAAAIESYHARNVNISNWMPQTASSSAAHYQPIPSVTSSASQSRSSSYAYGNTMTSRALEFDVPHYLPYPVGFKPNWNNLAPTTQDRALSKHAPASVNEGQRKNFRLSLLNVNEFTIVGLPTGWNSPPTSVAGLRVPIKSISREHGKAIFQQDKDEEGGGKWRIPLGAYHAFFAYLKSDPLTMVEGIPQTLLQMASLEKARQEKGYPEAQELIAKKVPAGLAGALAPFQRGGVDFVLSKHGRALIADDMGLGKTIQGIASMSVYHSEWPLLVLCPSGARYHWENEFRNWLGVKSAVNRLSSNRISKEALLRDNQIYVVPTSKAPLLPSQGVRVVICSYGLAPVFADSKKLYPRLFRCAIVDESHMLKNKASKRTASLLPILQAMNRCVLLSGTPAFARPVELWPQISILRDEKEGWWYNEEDFMEKYVRNGGPQRSAELNTMLRGTVMIRRLKNDILKSLPRKLREKAEVHVLNNEQRKEFQGLLLQLREGKGQLGKLARKQFGEDGRIADAVTEDNAEISDSPWHVAGVSNVAPGTAEHDRVMADEYQASKRRLDHDIRHRFKEGKHRIEQAVADVSEQMPPEQRDDLMLQLEGNLRAELEADYIRQFNDIKEEFKDFLRPQNGIREEPQGKRTSVLSRLYGLTGDVKIPLLVDMLQKWLSDPTKGKLCIFAHHISVLDSLEKQAGLSNVGASKSKFIRIDGSTLPKQRQDQINAFQSDPLVRIALLGITAAGVAVTLTASSTVWFAELFWTPAIMIQAEDRCHRIGQQARVKCLYFVAKGTVDDILWKLIEKKFKDLGEFVEGKEKLQLVVDNVFHGTKQLYGMFSSVEESDDDGDLNADDVDELEKIFQLDGDLEHDIQELGEEEQRILRESEAMEENDGEPGNVDTKVPALESFESALGKSEEAAIALSDDDSSTGSLSESNDVLPVDENGNVSFQTGSIRGCQLYTINIGDTKLGVEVKLFDQRIVVENIGQRRLDRLGPLSKPSVGDILVAVNGYRLALVPNVYPVMQYLQKVLQRPPVELTFVEIPNFVQYYKTIKNNDSNVSNVAHGGAAGLEGIQQQSISTKSDQVIDLVDDE